MKFVFHGGAREVGKSCIELQTKGDRFLFDAGLKFTEDGFEAPFHVFDVPNIDGLFLSHAHLDHTGALPLFEHYNMLCPIFCTQQTKELTKVMLKDSYKIARVRHLHIAYEKTDLKKVQAATRVVEFDRPYTQKNILFKFLNAGHIPGSSMILVKVEGKKILYTGDFKLRSTYLMKGAETLFDKNAEDLKDIDVLITESTYGNKSLMNRKEVEKAFLDKVTDVVKKGSVIVPVFSIGRAQEILMMLGQRKWSVPIYLDGMAVKITKNIITINSPYVNDKQLLATMFKRADLVTKDSKRKRIMNNRGIIVTTSGMIQGGPVLSYIDNMWGNPNNAILMTGFQCKRTNGRLLLDEGYVYLNGWKTYVKCQVQKFDFSGHSDELELKEFIQRVNPKNIIVNHGDAESADALGEWIKTSLKSRVFVPGVGDELDF
jgi:putative mRNA 3-end processing factor